MQTIDQPAGRTGELIAAIHDMIAGFRCAGTARLVKAGVSMTHLHVLWLLEHHGPLPMSRLAELLDVSLSNATGIVERMAERGLLERDRVPDDRRIVLVRIGDGGRTALDELEAVKHDRLVGILRHLDATQVERVVAAVGDLRDAIEAELGPDLHAGHDHHRNQHPAAPAAGQPPTAGRA